MCGIVAVLRRPSLRPVPTVAEIDGPIDEALAVIAPSGLHVADTELPNRLRRAAEALGGVDVLLRGVPGVRYLASRPGALVSIERRVQRIEAEVAAIEATLDAQGAGALEAANAALIAVKDAAWAIRMDRIRTARAVLELGGPQPSPGVIEAFWSIQVALSSLDRLEVRGRDSAGLHVLVSGHGLDVGAPSVRALLEGRTSDRLFTSDSVRIVDGAISFVYKAAAEIGELGDNTRALRDAIQHDDLLRLVVSDETARVAVLAHTRWASIGVISQANAHPLNSEELDRSTAYVVGALNGDVDNHADLIAADGLRIAPEITTDAKVIPTLVGRELAHGVELAEAFRRTVARFEGSVAIAAQAAAVPDEVLIALRGSGQALYVGLAEDAYIVASEPYGLVEETSTYLRLDGETPNNPANPTASRGQVVVLDAARAGELDGVRRFSYDGLELPVVPDDLSHAQITTRDIDRGAFPHFLLKEISESPQSFRKTLRGRIDEDETGLLRAVLGPETMSPDVRRRLADGTITRVLVIGQGTAAVAGQALARLLAALTAGGGLSVAALPATELSGFGMDDELARTLVIAISQSGTTTDTNRTVDLVRGRGATVIGIVNRRNSDLTDKADGVLYTSDGRDVEMSVASTKAFYAQVAAGVLLACAIAEAVSPGHAGDAHARHTLLAGLRQLPDAMVDTLALRPHIADVAHRFAPAKRYWAVVGNGPNRVAAEEVRIKASELCYKSISCDATEDKKHIDLSCEPLILVCAAGLSGSTADDVAKEVAIFRAHRASPIVVATVGDGRFQAALEVIGVPPVDERLAFVLAAMAGHLFAYEAALAIDAQARVLREMRAVVEAAIEQVPSDDRLLGRLATGIAPHATRFGDLLRRGQLDGHLEASTAVRLVGLLRYATGVMPLDAYAIEEGRVGTPSVLVDDLIAALNRGVDELTRPVDAIKHQAKTVTVGISRSDETLLAAPLVREVLAAGAGRDHLSYQALRVLAGLDPAVVGVSGFTRYRIDGDPAGDDATIHVVDRGGVSLQIPSRTDRHPNLRGTKRRVAAERHVTVARGRSDGRVLLLVPEVKAGTCVGLTLLHVRLAEHLPADVARSVLEAYGRSRYAALVDAVCETEPSFRVDLLADLPIVDLLTEPIVRLADHWKQG